MNGISKEQYIEHEVSIRLLSFKNDELYKEQDRVYRLLIRKMNILIILCGVNFIIVCLQAFKLI